LSFVVVQKSSAARAALDFCPTPKLKA